MAGDKSNSSSPKTILAAALVLMSLVGQPYGQSLSVGFYRGKCKSNQTTYDVETEIFKVVSGMYAADKTIVAALLRLLFHDAYSGTDGSLLLDGPEKTAPNNIGVRGYNVIDACQRKLNAICPGVVSCTDIMVIATRVSVALAGGSWYNVETGRRDGTTSSSQEAANLPSATITVPDALTKFSQRGLSAVDFVALLGCHTVGIIHCTKFIDRLYNFRGTRMADPSMNTTTLATLKKTCPSGGSNNFAYADQTPGSQLIVDKAYYQALKQGKGILEIDQQMALSPSTKNIVNNFATIPGYFDSTLGVSLNKLARYKVLTGTQGQIRKYCNLVNKY